MKANPKTANRGRWVRAMIAFVAVLATAGADLPAQVDDALLFKTHAKVLAKHHDLTLTFMARPLADDDGQSGHVHLSLLDADAAPIEARVEVSGYVVATAYHVWLPSVRR